jgi:hypothetical protein
MWHAHLGTCQDGGLHIPNPCPHTPTLLLAFGPLLPWIWHSSCSMAICSTPPPLWVYTLNHVWPQLSESYENLSCFGLVFDQILCYRMVAVFHFMTPWNSDQSHQLYVLKNNNSIQWSPMHCFHQSKGTIVDMNCQSWLILP